jgi:hypothetical protein
LDHCELQVLVGTLACARSPVIASVIAAQAIKLSEMPEMIGVSHRILTMYWGQLTGEFDGEEVTEEKLVNAITSVRAGPNSG